MVCQCGWGSPWIFDFSTIYKIAQPKNDFVCPLIVSKALLLMAALYGIRRPAVRSLFFIT